jgi:DNA-binding CsgD family transcriptional regulator/PAS domain-containing protein
MFIRQQPWSPIRVSISLSMSEVTRLQIALRMLLSPFDFENVADWRCETRREIASLLRSENSISFLPLEGEAPFLSDRPLAMSEYAEHYHLLDPTPSPPTTEAFAWPAVRVKWGVRDDGAWLRSEFYNDWVKRQSLFQPCGLMVARAADQLPCPGFERFAGVAGLWFYRDGAEPRVDGERELAILSILLPAFEAGIDMVLDCPGGRNRLASVLDNLGEGVVLFDEGGHHVYQNSAFGRLMANEPEARRLRMECGRIGQLVMTLAIRHASKSRPLEILGPAEREVRTAMARYRIRGSLAGPGLLESRQLALVVLDRVVPSPPAPRDLRERYGLTTREIAVSLLLADGHSNAEVARLLGVTIHTARRHAEHVLMKLGVHSRAAVSAKLRERFPER